MKIYKEFNKNYVYLQIKFIKVIFYNIFNQFSLKQINLY
jgi:hypothetical protein